MTKQRNNSTRDRIIDVSLELFNDYGERSITTNRIAERMDISPGNLYYHFRNKQQIIFELFLRYRGDIERFLRLPRDREITIEDKHHYLEAIFSCIWRYRFLHRDLEHLLSADANLREGYEALARLCLERAQAIYQGLVDAGILQATPAQVEALAINAWIMVTSWLNFLNSTLGSEADMDVSEAMIRRGVYQILMLEDGYVTAAARPAVEALQHHYHASLNLGREVATCG